MTEGGVDFVAQAAVRHTVVNIRGLQNAEAFMIG